MNRDCIYCFIEEEEGIEQETDEGYFLFHTCDKHKERFEKKQLKESKVGFHE